MNWKSFAQGLAVAWLLNILAVPLVFAFSSPEARWDRFWGAWSMVAFQAIVLALWFYVVIVAH